MLPALCSLLFAKRGKEIVYVLVEEGDGHGGFPKGHIESPETERETAARETWEECGVEPTFVDGFREETAYPKGNAISSMSRVLWHMLRGGSYAVKIMK